MNYSSTTNPPWVLNALNNSTIILDTCSVLHRGFHAFIGGCSSVLKEAKRKMHIPTCVIREINMFLNESGSRGELAREAILAIEKYTEQGLVDIMDESSEGFRPDEFFLSYAPNRVKERIMFITQDHALAQDLLNFNKSKSCLGYPIKVKMINALGHIQNHNLNICDATLPAYRFSTNAGDILRRLGF